jgi:hypothetical protein
MITIQLQTLATNAKSLEFFNSIKYLDLILYSELNYFVNFKLNSKRNTKRQYH